MSWLEVLLFHVDDFIHTSESDAIWHKFVKECRQHGINIEDMGKPRKFLGLYFEEIKNGWRLHLEPYIYEVLKKFKLGGLSVVHQPAPMSRLEQGKPLEEEHKKLYRPLIGLVALWVACAAWS